MFEFSVHFLIPFGCLIAAGISYHAGRAAEARKHTTVNPDRIGLDTVLQCYPQAVQTGDDLFRLCYMAETQEGIDLQEG